MVADGIVDSDLREDRWWIICERFRWWVPIGWEDERSSVFIYECDVDFGSRSSSKTAGACPSNPTKKQKAKVSTAQQALRSITLSFVGSVVNNILKQLLSHSLIGLNILENYLQLLRLIRDSQAAQHG